MTTWKEAIADLGAEVLVRNGVLFVGQDLGTPEAEVFASFPIGDEKPDTDEGKKVLSEIQKKIGK